GVVRRLAASRVGRGLIGISRRGRVLAGVGRLHGGLRLPGATAAHVAAAAAGLGLIGALVGGGEVQRDRGRVVCRRLVAGSVVRGLIGIGRGVRGLVGVCPLPGQLHLPGAATTRE